MTNLNYVQLKSKKKPRHKYSTAMNNHINSRIIHEDIQETTIYPESTVLYFQVNTASSRIKNINKHTVNTRLTFY